MPNYFTMVVMEFTPVRISTVKPDKNLTFDLYIYFKETYLCYIKKGHLIPEEKHKKLKKQKVAKFFISTEDENFYQNFLDSILSETAVSKLDIEQKVDIAEGVAANAIERLQKAPDQKSYKAAVKAVKGINEIIFSDPEALKNIFSKSRNDQADQLVNHSFNVCALSMKLATYQKCTQEEIENIGVAALMHDIGFSQLPKESVALFSKPKSELTHEEKKKFYEHTEVAANVLRDKPFINPTILELIYNHEEVLSGNGPHKKKKLSKLEEILSMVNNYDKRILTKAITPQMAVKEIMIDELGNYNLALLNDLKAVLKHEGLID